MQRFTIIGLGRFGSRLAASLALAGQEVLAIDRDSRIVEDIRDRVTMAIAMDGADDQALRSHGVEQSDVAIVGIGNNLEAAALVTVTLKQLEIKRVVSRAMNPTAGLILARIGADEVIYPEDESADRLANRLANPHYLKQLELDASHSIVEMRTPSQWVGKTLTEVDARKEYGINVAAIRRQEGKDQGVTRRRIHLPDPTEPLQSEDVLILIGEDINLAKLQRKTDR